MTGKQKDTLYRPSSKGDGYVGAALIKTHFLRVKYRKLPKSSSL